MFCLMVNSWSGNTSVHGSGGKTQDALQLDSSSETLQVRSVPPAWPPHHGHFPPQTFLIYVSRNDFLTSPPRSWHRSWRQRGAGRTLVPWSSHSGSMQRRGRRCRAPPFPTCLTRLCRVSGRLLESLSSQHPAQSRHQKRPACGQCPPWNPTDHGWPAGSPKSSISPHQLIIAAFRQAPGQWPPAAESCLNGNLS